MSTTSSLTTLTVRLAIGREVSLSLDEAAVGPACFALGIRKCGTTLLNRICGALAAVNGRHFVNAGGALFFGNIPTRHWQDDPMLTQLLRPGNVYGGIRDVPRAWLDAELFRNGLKLLIVRDPRDALVSEYYSNAYSHPIPAQNADHGEMAEIMLAQRKYAIAHPIDEYVVERASALVRSIMEYAVVARMPNTRMFRYEDVVFDKAGLIASIARHFGWDAPAEAVKRILSRVDVRPDKEDPQAFVRQVTPGDHRRKLERATIARLGELLWPAMNLLGYSVD